MLEALHELVEYDFLRRAILGILLMMPLFSLLGTLVVVWVCIGLYLLRQWQKRKKIEKND